MFRVLTISINRTRVLFSRGVTGMEDERLRDIRVLLSLAGIDRREAAEYLSLTSGALNRKLRGVRTLMQSEEEQLRRKVQEKITKERVPCQGNR